MRSLVNVVKIILGVLICVWIWYVSIYVRFKHPEYTETQLFLYTITFGNIDINDKGKVNE